MGSTTIIRFIFLFFLFVCSFSVVPVVGQQPLGNAASSTQNYVQRTVYRRAFSSVQSNPSTQHAMRDITYYDGLGRPLQVVGVKASGGTATGTLLSPTLTTVTAGRPTTTFPTRLRRAPAVRSSRMRLSSRTVITRARPPFRPGSPRTHTRTVAGFTRPPRWAVSRSRGTPGVRGNRLPAVRLPPGAPRLRNTRRTTRRPLPRWPPRGVWRATALRWAARVLPR